MNFFLRYKKIFIIAGFILIVFLWSYFLYIIFFKPSPPSTVETEPVATTTISTTGLPSTSEGGQQIITTTQEGLPVEATISETAQGGLTKTTRLNNVNSLNTTASTDGKSLQYYDKETGKFYRIDNNGTITTLSDKVFHQVDDVTWSPTKNKAILEYPDGSNTIYNFETDNQITLPKHWEDFDFSPNGELITAKSIGIDSDNRWLVVSNEDASKIQPIESLGDNEATVYSSWSPNNQTIAMYTKGAGLDQQDVYFVGLNDENFKSITIEGRGFQPQWSPQGDQLLYSVYSTENDMKPLLWITNAQGESIGTGRKNLSIETWADKCTFSGDSELYCAVPQSLPEGAGLFPEMANATPDLLYKINTRTGLKKLVAVPDSGSTMSNLIVSDDEKYLYFTDQGTGSINQIQLK